MDSPRDAILKEMGITQWVLRDPVAATDTDAALPDIKTQDSSSRQGLASPEMPAMANSSIEPAAKKNVQDVPMQTADIASSLIDLRAQVAACTNCELAKTRTQTVFGEGPERADWLLVGEAPGQQEDRQGRPFVGRAGQLLSQMIRALDKTREQIFIANTLKCRPPNNRDPLPEELQACEPYLLKQIELIRPKVMVALGRISAQALLKSDQPLGRLRGKVYYYGPDKIPLIVTYHPAYLLRQPADKAKVWTDLLLAYQQTGQ